MVAEGDKDDVMFEKIMKDNQSSQNIQRKIPAGTFGVSGISKISNTSGISEPSGYRSHHTKIMSQHSMNKIQNYLKLSNSVRSDDQ